MTFARNDGSASGELVVNIDKLDEWIRYAV